LRRKVEEAQKLMEKATKQRSEYESLVCKVTCKIRMTWLAFQGTFRSSYYFEYILTVTAPFTEKCLSRLEVL
jgi:hypothetical protein